MTCRRIAILIEAYQVDLDSSSAVRWMTPIDLRRTSCRGRWGEVVL